MKNKISYSILAILILGGLFSWITVESQVVSTPTSVQITPLPVPTTIRDKTNANNNVVVDSSGALKVAIGGSSSSIVTTKNLQVSTNTPTASTNTALVHGWADEYGRQLIKSYDNSSDTIKVKEVAHPILQTLGGDGTWELLSGVSTNQDGVWFDVSHYKHFSLMMCPSAATNHWIYIDASLNSGTNWVNISSNYFNSTNNTLVQFSDIKVKYLRARYVGTNETTTVRGFAGT